MSAPRGYMTFDEVQEYLGHSNRNSTSVWLNRHGVEAQRVYRRADVMKARAGREPQVDTNATSVTSTGVSRTAHGA